MFMPMVYSPTVLLSPRVAAVPMAPVVPVVTPRIAAVPVVPTVPVVPVVPTVPVFPARPAYAPMMPPSPRHMMHPPRRRAAHTNFNVEGVLHNGEFTSLHFRDSDFRGVPDYVREELMMNYSKYPLTDVTVSSSEGRVLIDASPRRYDDLDFVQDYYPRERRLVGFNEVRGEPRDYMRIPRHARYYH